jgi:hypothetical protein
VSRYPAQSSGFIQRSPFHRGELNLRDTGGLPSRSRDRRYGDGLFDLIFDLHDLDQAFWPGKPDQHVDITGVFRFSRAQEPEIAIRPAPYLLRIAIRASWIFFF